MNGYLQRLALRAMKPVESVHPVLGSMFSSPKYGLEREGSPMEGQEDLSSTLTESPNPVESARAVVGSVFATPKHASDERDGVPMEGDNFPKSEVKSLVSRAPDAPRPLHDPSPWPEPLVPSERLSSLQVEPKLAAPRTQHDIVESNRALDMHREGREQEDISQSHHEPLVTQSFIRPNNREMFPLESPVFPSAGRKQSDFPHRPAHAEREPDEIQIHIGRIEVTAVSQAAARAPVKPAHKALSLEEYLKRRDGRPR